ncbi:hypothetical protein LZ496_12025 [Sphingomonas sp. NSE70-1]|uniref:Uncharacterized protein n=1 Tax=Sphingomonas caseinilyticus TaxID=2908205 RepID=A0ABT0RWX4_9SPHN|nr:hypothetical protein [Sphingomonas caseinilyticus]MCL6699508.1 hypothetical protein [Sphingomonas caseinilyticus]
MIFKRAVAKLRAQDWTAIAIELVIVTVGVLIALAAQQWAEDRSWNDKVEATRTALRFELAEHYDYAVEYRVIYPCLQAQIYRLRDRVLASGSTLDPAPLYSEEDGSHYVFRMPGKNYPTDAWEAAVSDGTIRSFDPALRRQLAGHYTQLPEMAAMLAEVEANEPAFVALAHRLPLDPAVRYSIIKDIERVRGRFEYLDMVHGQLIENIEKAGMLPTPENAERVTKRYGTYRFCKAHGLPMRSFKDAMQAVPN